MSTGPQQIIPIRNGPTTPGGTHAVDLHGDLQRLVEETLERRGLSQAQAQAVGQDADALIRQAARKVPSWVSLAFVFFGVPSLGSFVATAQAVWGLPAQATEIKAELETQRALHARQQAQLDRIERLLQGGPTSLPIKEDK